MVIDRIGNLASEQFLYLTTRGRKSGKLREIEIWFTHRDGRFYVIAEYPTSQWVRNLKVNPLAKVRIAGRNYSAAAHFLSAEADAPLKAAIQKLSLEKYGWSDGLVVELTPQSEIGPES